MLKKKEEPDILKGIDVSGARPTIINWPMHVQSIGDGYRGFRGIPHGVQKDICQNSWDARINKKGRGWKLIFELVEGKTNYLTATDEGTTGLTGRILTEEEMTYDMPPKEKWGRFEGLAFTKGPSEEALGSRGRGKFIFVCASNQRTILYDTLRSDKSYRFGMRWVTPTQSPVNAWDDDDGREKLKEVTHNAIQPLAKQGTRVIIVDPTDELIKTVRDGSFLRFIGEIWWEIIKKYNAKIVLRYRGKETKATVPPEFKLSEKDGKNVKVWLRKNVKIKVGDAFYKIKYLHMARDASGTVPDDIKGIAVQRRGMKICAIPAEDLPREIADSIYGYVSFDEDLEDLILPEEGPEHYSYNWKTAGPRNIKHFVKVELIRFAQQKLGWGVDPKKILHQRLSRAEERARMAANKIASDMKILGGTVSPPPPGPTKPPRPPTTPAEIRLEMPEFTFPHASLRVNYGETMRDIVVNAVNDTKQKVAVGLRFYIFFGAKNGKIIHQFIDKKTFKLDPQTKQKFGPYDMKIDDKLFAAKGLYSARAKLVSMEKGKEGDVIDVRTRKFWVEEDQPGPGVFEKFTGLPFSDKFPKQLHILMGKAEPGAARGHIFYYNMDHPEYKAHYENEDELTDYLVTISTYELPKIALMQTPPAYFKSEELKDPLKIAEKIAVLISEAAHYYRGG